MVNDFFNINYAKINNNLKFLLLLRIKNHIYEKIFVANWFFYFTNSQYYGAATAKDDLSGHYT